MDPETHNPKPRRTWCDGVLIAAFLVLLWAPMVDMLLHLDRSPASGENRLPARRPRLRELQSGPLQKFLANSEAYFNDHFGFRNKLIHYFQRGKFVLYHDHDVHVL